MAIRTDRTGASPFDQVTIVAIASIAVALLVMAIKYVAYLRTGSVALYSDAIESIVNVVTAAVALMAVRISAQPADANHPFGHHKVEYISAVAEGVLVIVAAILILHEAYQAIRVPRDIDAPLEGMAINAGATVLNAFWAWFLISRGRRWRSPALAADGWHLVTDVLTSVGVVAGLGIAALTGWALLDPLIAALVALNVLFTGWRLARESVSGLIDEAVDPATLQHIRQTISANADGALEVHDLRTRVAGRATFIEFHLVVPGTMTVAAAHAICDRIEAALLAEAHGAEILIHIEPEGEAHQKGVVVL